MNWPAFLAIVCCAIYLLTPLERDRWHGRRRPLMEPPSGRETPIARGNGAQMHSGGSMNETGSANGSPHLAVDAPALHPPDPPGRGSGHPNRIVL